MGARIKEIPSALLYDEKQGAGKRRSLRTLKQYGSAVRRIWCRVPALTWRRSLLLMVADI